MNQITKKILLGIGVLSITIVGGCSSSDAKDKKEKTENKTEQTKLIQNNRYVSPLNPTEAQIKAYNDLSSAIETKNSEEEAKQVATSFAYDFFMLSNKKSADDMGGLQFLPSNSIRKFMEFANSYYYGNYPTIVNEYGKDNLPEVTGVKVNSSTAGEYTYLNQTYAGFKIKVTIAYADTKLPDKALLKNAEITVIKIHDYDFNRSYNYKKAGLVFEGEMKECWRVLSVE